jgi:hypothetical protein
MIPNHFKIIFHRSYPGGFSSVRVLQMNGQENFWVLSNEVIQGLMERQAGNAP